MTLRSIFWQTLPPSDAWPLILFIGLFFTGGGCISPPFAQGRFAGVVSAVPVRTVGGTRHTAYLMTVEHGPNFGKRGTGPSTVGVVALLVKDAKGNIYPLDAKRAGPVLHVRGELRPMVPQAKGEPILRLDGSRLPDRCIRVTRLEPFK